MVLRVIKRRTNDLSKPPQLTALWFPMHVYEVRPRRDHRGVDLISDALHALRRTAR
jgi:hypothetical protein